MCACVSETQLKPVNKIINHIFSSNNVKRNIVRDINIKRTFMLGIREKMIRHKN